MFHFIIKFEFCNYSLVQNQSEFQRPHHIGGHYKQKQKAFVFTLHALHNLTEGYDTNMYNLQKHI